MDNLTPEDIDRELTKLEHRKAELTKLLQTQREAERAAALETITVLMTQHGIAPKDLATLTNRKRTTSRQSSVGGWIHPATGARYVKGAIPKALQAHMREIGWSGSFKSFREAHMERAA